MWHLSLTPPPPPHHHHHHHLAGNKQRQFSHIDVDMIQLLGQNHVCLVQAWKSVVWLGNYLLTWHDDNNNDNDNTDSDDDDDDDNNDDGWWYVLDENGCYKVYIFIFWDIVCKQIISFEMYPFVNINNSIKGVRFEYEYSWCVKAYKIHKNPVSNA